MTKPEDPRAAILDAAYKVLCEEGLPSLSYTSIAEVGDVSRQLVRYYFKSSDDLMFAIGDLISDAYRTRLMEHLEASGSVSRVDALLDFCLGMGDAPIQEDDHAIYDALMSRAAGSNQIRSNLRGQFVLSGHLVSHELRVDYPELTDQHCEELAYIIISQLYGHGRMVGSLEFTSEHKRITRRAIEQNIEAYRKKISSDEPALKVWKSQR